MKNIETMSILSVITVLFPCTILITGSSQLNRISVAAMTWSWNTENTNSSFAFGLDIFIANLSFTFLRLVFIMMFYRYYQNKTSKVRALIVGLLAELQMNLIFLVLILTSPYPTGSIPIMLPIPILFIVAFTLIRYNPVPQTIVWTD